ncbi:MAG: metal ABC transporter permease [Erysipelotrichaceae bacterium]|nr:metal ABC transporter permease [Erysipelotrichaceae bacterium]
MIDTIIQMFSYPFMVRAVIVGTFIALASSLLGVSLVLKRFSMIGDGLSHVGFGTLALATALNAAPLTVSIPIVVIAAFFLLRITENSKIKGDAAIALISTGSLAIGVMIVSKTTGLNTDVCNYLFGSILGISKWDANLSIALCITIIITFVLFYNRIFSITFDEPFSQATGTNSKFVNMLIAMLTALIIVLGMRIMGALLISSLIVFPSLTSMRLCKRYKAVIINSAIISVACLWIGMFISYYFDTPSGASIVICNIIVFFVYWLISCIKGNILHEK